MTGRDEGREKRDEKRRREIEMIKVRNDNQDKQR